MENIKEVQQTHSQERDGSHKLIQYIASLIVTLNLLSSGMHYGWSSPSLPKLMSSDSKIQMTNNDGSWLAVTVLFGSMFGSCLAGVLLNVIGRKKTILLTSLPLFISWMMIAFAESFYVLIIARFFAGIAEGMSFCSSPTYVGEIADKKIRGFLATVLTTGSLIGVFIINILGSYLTIKVTALISSVVPVLTFFTFLWMPESPYFLLMKKRTDEAKKTLTTLKGSSNVQSEIDIIQQFIVQENISIKKYWNLFQRQSNRKALFIVLGIRAVQQCSGATAITFYAQTIFTESSDFISPVVSSSIYFACLVLSTVISLALVDKAGRRPLLIVSALGAGICLLIEACYFCNYPKTYSGTNDFSILAAVALVGYVLFFGLGLQTMPLVVESEMFETNLKAFAVCISDTSFSVIGVIVSKSFQYMKDEFELYVPFLIFSICCGIGVTFVFFMVPETKGKTLEEIQFELVEVKKKSVAGVGSTEQP